jgi:HTH-type transcriptional regulator/antitoxin HipB
MKTKTNITTLDQILDKKYGVKGELLDEKWEQEFEVFRLGILLEEARTKLGMT